VIIWLIELDLEEYLLCLVSNRLLESLLVISQPACRVRGRRWGVEGRRLEIAEESFVIYGRDSRLEYPVIWVGVVCLGWYLGDVLYINWRSKCLTLALPSMVSGITGPVPTTMLLLCGRWRPCRLISRGTV
jgi:hypothetical protein